MPYWRLSSFYFFYFAALGALVPYWGLFLQFKGFEPLAIGSLMGMLMATKIVAPNVWGWLGDHLGHRMQIVRFASLAALFIFTLIFQANTFVTVGAVMVAFSFFWHASLPQFEVITFAYLQQQVERYSRIRLWGSVGFILTVVVVGMLVDQQGASAIAPVVVLMFFGVLLSSLLVADPHRDTPVEAQGSILSTLKKPAIIAFFVSVFLMQVSHGPYYTFYSIYLAEYGYSKTAIGLLWGLGVLAEVLIFLVMHKLLLKQSAKSILAASLLLASIRWILIASFPQSLPIMLFSQVLHAATFGTFHASAIHLVHHYFKGKHQGRGQALYSSLSFGAGGAVGSFASGLLWQHWGADVTYMLAAITALIGAVIAYKYIDTAHDF